MLGNASGLEMGDEVGVSFMMAELELWGDFVMVACMGVMKPGWCRVGLAWEGDGVFLVCDVVVRWNGRTVLMFKCEGGDVVGSVCVRDRASTRLPPLLVLVLMRPVGMAITVLQPIIFWGAWRGDDVGGGRGFGTAGDDSTPILPPGLMAGRWAGTTECLWVWDRTLTPLTASLRTDGDERTVGGDGEAEIFLGRCGDTCSCAEGVGLAPAVDGGMSDWTRPLAALLSMARAWEMESSEGAVRSSSRESDRQMGSGGDDTRWTADAAEGGVASTEMTDRWRTAPLSWGLGFALGGGKILFFILRIQKTNYEQVRYDSIGYRVVNMIFTDDIETDTQMTDFEKKC